MRLLLVSQDFPPKTGGVQTYALELARRFARRADVFSVLAPSAWGQKRIDHEQPFVVHRTITTSDAMPFTSVGTIASLLRSGGYDTVFCAQWQTAAAALAAAKTAKGVRVFAAAHGRELLFDPFPEWTGLNAAHRAARKSTLSAVQGVFAVSRFTAGLVREQGVSVAQIYVEPNGCDAERYRPLDVAALRKRLGLEGRRVLLTVGRLVPRKGMDTVIEALPAIAAAVPDAAYVIAGDGADEARLRALAAERGVADRVRFVGAVPQDELPMYYNACDLFAMPAREDGPNVEGFGLVFLEAGACERPVIGAAAGGVPDAVVHGETGLLVPPGNAAAVAQAAIDVLSNPEHGADMGKRARARILGRFTWDIVADRIYDVLVKGTPEAAQAASTSAAAIATARGAAP